MRIPIFQVDAFTETLFGGNPAAVCPLDAWLPDATLQAIAAENNLSETAFFVRDGGDYRLRWFTPGAEVPLCGHATLASAFVIMTLLEGGRDEVTFHTLSGPLKVVPDGEGFAMTLPRRSLETVAPPAGLAGALGGAPESWLAGEREYVAVFDSEAAIRALTPDIRAFTAFDRSYVIATAPGERTDFVLRFFAPSVGVDEDPVTGSAQCVTAPYWAARLGRDTLTSHQASARGGDLRSTVLPGAVRVAGGCVLYLEGSIVVPR
ncbi:PhzF family phenazine biosynthesis protein [Emcibacter sp. SYSU 3D8]|uniref:PhzF family phenazine biosynthesis protein n=1 Tax=Emcibacter sp. SYSU 3D8 TaxID=3133969 RepID=UPI0031FE7C7F